MTSRRNSSKPTVRSATYCLSYVPSVIHTYAIAMASAASVPGRGAIHLASIGPAVELW